MEKLKFGFTKIILLIFIFSSISHGGDQFIEVEKKLEERDFSKAKVLFEDLKKKYKSKKHDISRLEDFSISFIKLMDKDIQYMENCKDYTCQQVDMKGINSEFSLLKNYAGFFSKDFKDYLYNLYITTFNESQEYNSLIVKEKNNHRKKLREERKQKKALEIARNKQEEERYRQERSTKFKKEELEREKTRKEKIVNANKKDSQIDSKAKRLGYKGYAKLNISQLIYKTQKNGGLEKYLNTIVGCSELDKIGCQRLNERLKILQILDNGLIYHFYKHINNESFEYMISTNKEPNKIYQEGQKIDNGFYVFKGMFTYKTILGIQKSIPNFEKIDLK